MRVKTTKPCQMCSTELKNTKSKYCSIRCQHDWQSSQRNILIESGLAENSHQVKQYLLRKHGNTCLSVDCAWDFSKKAVNVELEHIDGNAENNTLENCTLLCPNCHSTTPTYKAKNKGNGRHTRMQRKAEGKSF